MNSSLDNIEIIDLKLEKIDFYNHLNGNYNSENRSRKIVIKSEISPLNDKKSLNIREDKSQARRPLCVDVSLFGHISPRVCFRLDGHFMPRDQFMMR